MPSRAAASVVALALLLAASPSPSLAQGRWGRPARGAEAGWPPVEVGVHGGFAYRASGGVVGGHLRIPVLPSGHLELAPTGDVTVQARLRETMVGADLVAISGGRRGGLYVGGGLTWRNSLYDSIRETRRHPTVVVGARSPAMGSIPFGTQIEVRWVHVDQPVKPKYLTLGINFPLWGRGARGRR